MTDLTIIIISYNTATITLKCIKTVFAGLKKAPFSTEVIVLDNNSKDDSVEKLAEFKKKNKDSNIDLKIIKSKENLGFAKGNNKAIKDSNGKVILLLNSDTEVIGSSLVDLYKYYVSQHDFAFLGAKLLNRDGSDQTSAAPFYSIPVVIGALFLRGDYWGLTRFSPNKVCRIDWVSGACIMTTRKIYDKVGGFDENIFMYMDEVDLLYRAKQQNYLTGFYPHARFIHLGSASSSGRTEPILQVYQGFLYFYKKHASTRSLIILKNLLQLKAMIAFIIGKVTKNKYLISTYEQALEIVKNN